MSIIEDYKEGSAPAGRRPTLGLPEKSSPPFHSESGALSLTLKSTADEPAHVQSQASDSGFSAPCGNEAVDDKDEVDDGSDDATPAFASTNKQIAPTPESDAVAEVASPHCSLQSAYTSCKTIRELTGEIEISRWNSRAIAMLPRALAFIDAYKADPNGYAKLCNLAKDDGINIPKANKVKIWLIAVKICMEPTKSGGRSGKKKRDQTEWSRFANVVFVAMEKFIKPKEAAEWLRKKTLKDLVDEAREMKKGDFANDRPKTVPAMLKEHKNIAKLFARGKGADFDEVRARIKEALAALDAEIAAKAEAARSIGDEVVS